MMKKLSILIFLSVILLFTGCSQKLEDGILKVDKEYKEKNAKTKVYYEDLSEKFVVEANKKIVEDLNNQEIIPNYWWAIAGSDEVKDYKEALAKFNNQKNIEQKKVEGGTFKLLDDNRTIFYDKKYTNLNEAFQDLQNIYVFLAKSKLRVTVKDSSFRDKYMTSVFFSKDTKDVLDGLKFETKYSSIQEVLANEIKKQIELGGWQIVDSPEKADKQVYLDISRDYALIELEYFKREKKNIKFSSLESDTNNVKFYQDRRYNGNHIVLGQSAMNLASASNGNVVAAAIGLSVAGVFSLLGNEKAPDKENTTGSFISLRIFDKKENTDTIKIYDSFIKSAYDKRDIEDLLQKINETINIDPDSKKYNINWYNNFLFTTLMQVYN
mgnify:FL=1